MSGCLFVGDWKEQEKHGIDNLTCAVSISMLGCLFIWDWEGTRKPKYIQPTLHVLCL